MMEDLLTNLHKERRMTWIEAFEECKAHRNHQVLDYSDECQNAKIQVTKEEFESEDVSDDKSKNTCLRGCMLRREFKMQIILFVLTMKTAM